jgi:hypothetical protein
MRVIAICARWWRVTVHLVATAVVIAVVSHNAANPYPVRPADGAPFAPHVQSLP